MNLRVCICSRIRYICCCTFFQVVSATGGDLNVHIVSGEAFSSFVISMVKMISSGGLPDYLNISGSRRSLFFYCMSEINFFTCLGM